MLIRAVIKYFRARIGRLDIDVPGLCGHEREAVVDMFTTKKYKPHQGLTKYGSYNLDFKDYIFSMKAFCRVFQLYLCKSTNLWEALVFSSHRQMIDPFEIEFEFYFCRELERGLCYKGHL